MSPLLDDVLRNRAKVPSTNQPGGGGATLGCGFILGLVIFSLFSQIFFFSFFVRASKMSYFTAFSRTDQHP